jgi:hypothetical protein
MAQTKVKLISDGVIVQGNLHASHGITTAHIGEGSNLYYTDARVGSYLSTNSFATESYVGTQITNLVDSSPSALNTLNELAAALGDDANFSTTVTNSIALKAPIASPTFTGFARAPYIRATASGDIALGGVSGISRIQSNASNDIRFLNSSNQDLLTLVASTREATFARGATFAGEVTISTETQYLNFKKASTADILSTIVSETDAGTGGKLRFLTKRNGDTQVNALILDDNQNATFAGNVNVPYGKGYLMDTTGAVGSNFVKTINDYETVIGTDRGSAGFAVVGNSNIRIGFGQAYTAAQTKLFINSSGRVGIGTDSPNAKLDVRNNDGNASGLHVVADFNQNGGAGAQMILGYYANGSSPVGPLVYAANGMPQLINASGGIYFSNDLNFSSNFLYTFRDAVGINNPNSISATANTGYTMCVGRSHDSGSGVSGSISAVGTIRASAFTTGINTTAGIGGSNGDVNAAEIGPGYLNLSRDDTAGAQQIRFEKNGALHSYIETTTSGLNIGNANVYLAKSTNQGQLFFGTADNQYEIFGGGNWGYMGYNTSGYHRFFGSGTERMRITNAGLVGIGENSPVAQLDVQLHHGTGAFNKDCGARIGRIQYAWHTGQYYANNSYSYVHYKTNLWMGGSHTNSSGYSGNTHYIMGGFYIKSYKYGSLRGDGTVQFHNWSGGFAGLTVQNSGNWTNFVQSPYTSSDGFCVIVLAHNYYSTPNIDFHQSFTAYPWRNVQVTASSQSNSTTGVY